MLTDTKFPCVHLLHFLALSRDFQNASCGSPVLVKYGKEYGNNLSKDIKNYLFFSETVMLVLTYSTQQTLNLKA